MECVHAGVSVSCLSGWRPCHTSDACTVSLVCGPSCEPSGVNFDWMLHDTCHICTVSLRCELAGAEQNHLALQIVFYKHHIQWFKHYFSTVSPRFIGSAVAVPMTSMLLHSTWLSESFAAHWTFVRLLTTVYSAVPDKISWFYKLFATNRTFRLDFPIFFQFISCIAVYTIFTRRFVCLQRAVLGKYFVTQ